MKLNISLTALFFASTISINASTWDLDSCINYAVTHNLTVKQRINDTESAQQNVTDAKSRYLPSVSANAGQSWNLGRGLTAENTYANRNTSNFQWSASFSLPIFSGMSTTRQVTYAKANLAAITEQYEAAKESITLNVISAYLQVLYSRELNDVAVQQVELSRYELTRQQTLLEAGKIPEIDMLEANSQLAQDEYNAAQTANDIKLALLDLAQLLELKDIEGFDISPLKTNEMIIMSPDDAYAAALQYNHTLRSARNNIYASERNIEVAKTGYIPTVSFNAGLGSSYYKLSGYQNDPFGKQMKNNYSTYFGFSLNIPIFDAFSTRNSVKRAKIALNSAKLQYEEAELQLYKEIQQAYYRADGANQKLKAAIVADETAQKSFEAMQEKYNIGRATPTEYEQSKSKAFKATAERIQARYELILRTRILNFYSEQH
jgi:outer membrane protein